jgi:hypothetical protein
VQPAQAVSGVFFGLIPGCDVAYLEVESDSANVLLVLVRIGRKIMSPVDTAMMNRHRELLCSGEERMVPRERSGIRR